MKKIVGWIVSGLFLAGALISLVFALTPQYPEYDDALNEFQIQIISLDIVGYGSDDPHFLPNSYYVPTSARFIGERFEDQNDQLVICFLEAGNGEGEVLHSFVFVYFIDSGQFLFLSSDDERYPAYLLPLGILSQEVPEWKLYGDTNPAWYFFLGFLVLAGGGISFTFLKKRPT